MQKRTLGDMQLHLAVFYSLLSFTVLKRVISESLREYSAHPFLALTCRLLSSSFFHTSLCPSPFYFLGSVLYGSGWVKACVYSRKFAAPIDPWAILLRALDSQGSPLVIGKSLLDQNTSRRASLSHSFSSLLRFRIRLDSVPVLLTDWPRARFRSDLEGLILGSALFHLFHSIWKGLSRYSTFSNCFFFYYPSLSFLFDNLYFSLILWRLPAFCVGSLMVILRTCGRRIEFFCRRSGSSQTSRPHTQLLNLSLFPEQLGPQSSIAASWPDIYPWAKAGNTLLLWSSRGRDG